MGLCLVAIALPDVPQNPTLKAMLMALTFVVRIASSRNFLVLNALDCACANDWRRWVVEGFVHGAGGVPTLVGVVSL